MEARENIKNIENIAFYRFVTIEDPVELRQKLFDRCQILGLKGTILIAEEGINGMLAGVSDKMDAIVEMLKEDSRFCNIFFKRSQSSKIPFKRLLVKVKREILTLRNPDIDPRGGATLYIKPEKLRDEISEALRNGQPMTLLDVRNDFEIGHGTFKNSLNPHLKSFGEFSEFVKKRLDIDKNQKIVTFCTGGIRCEKAALILQKEGFKNVFQLEGGILEYLRETGGQYFEGNCFVFDEREALNNQLQPLKP